MTKTLTEQWRDNDLADDKLYYWIISDGQELVQNKLGMCAYRLCNDSDKIECLAPVPSYDEYQKLQKKLEIATKALKEAHKFPSTTTLKKWCEERLKEMEGVK